MNFKESSYTKLQKRAERLVFLLEKGAPELIIAREVTLIIMAAIGYCGQEFSKMVFEWLFRDLCVKSGYCSECQETLINTYNEIGRQRGLCDDCLKIFEESEKKFEDEWGDEDEGEEEGPQ